ncbi:MAG: ABC transporter permease [Paracoccaceae bacterium]|jgi:peptide/nickel transport system permease protein|nr:ABC transporter permease [Marinovum sp.]MDA9822985.1 ABC transporter permease [Paracoccaceae bacterium]MBP08533.1 ABC transporter permease [Marinovum sp.]MBT6526857.1 ABC transporter permease [Marinovum sp.]MBT7223510.1 ABC transporter permease [Marinovum sp.]|tara:strand:+ start:3878 stop:4837 length:960 start_codon:yes stop_codon:yes gene_type:complete
MLRMLLRRCVLGAVTVAIVSAIIFLGVELLPGDACTAFLERDAKGQMLENCRKDFGLDRPALTRYFEWAGNALQGDLGMSASGRKSIAELVGHRMKNSLLLAAVSLSVGVPMAIFLGVITGLWRDRPIDLFFSTAAILAMTIPEFVSATVLILIFSVWLGWLPGIVVTSASAPASEFFPEILLPVFVLAMVMMAHILRMVRSSVIEVMAGDYIQMATLKGVPYWRIVFSHALPNALLPAINVVALTIAWLLGGVVVIEVVFNYPGLGRMMIDAISDRDLPVVQAIALIVASVYVGVNLTADILTMVANPRLRTLNMRRG